MRYLPTSLKYSTNIMMSQADLQPVVQENYALKAKVDDYERKYNDMIEELAAVKKQLQDNGKNAIPAEKTKDPIPIEGSDPINIAALISKVNTLESNAYNAVVGLQDVNQRLDNMIYFTNELRAKLNSLDQYSRINNLLLHHLKNIPFEKKGYEFTRWVVEELNRLFPESVIGFPITEGHIETSHPMYRYGAATDVVIVRFSSRGAQNQIFYNKKHQKLSSRRLLSQSI